MRDRPPSPLQGKVRFPAEPQRVKSTQLRRPRPWFATPAIRRLRPSGTSTRGFDRSRWMSASVRSRAELSGARMRGVASLWPEEDQPGRGERCRAVNCIHWPPRLLAEVPVSSPSKMPGCARSRCAATFCDCSLLHSEHVFHRMPQLQSTAVFATHNSIARFKARALGVRLAIGVDTKPIK
jgi:hypothetical protein